MAPPSGAQGYEPHPTAVVFFFAVASLRAAVTTRILRCTHKGRWQDYTVVLLFIRAYRTEASWPA